MAEDWISIRRVLSEIYHTPEPFTLDFVTQEGERRYKSSVSLGGAKKRRQKEGEPSPRTRKGTRIKENHLLLLYDNVEHHPFYVRKCLLIRWNGLRIRHYYGKGPSPTQQ